MTRTWIALLFLSLFAPVPAEAQISVGQHIRCESHDGRDNFCPIDTRGGVVLREQLSSSACIEGRSWGWDRQGIWVRSGCRAEFVVGSFAGRPGYGGGERLVRCESIDNRRNFCRADTRGGVVLIDQLSRSACIEGRSWGVARDGIWVAGGCRAEFAIGGRGRPLPPYGNRPGAGVIVCESRDARYEYCPVPVRHDVRLIRQLSRSECRFRRSWGFDRGGVWVDRGCRAEFEIR